MNLENRISAWLPESLNPVFVKELRQNLRSSTTRNMAIALLFTEGLVSFIYLFFGNSPDNRDLPEMLFSFYLFVFILALLAHTLSLAVSCAREQRQDALLPEFTTSLSPATIFNGRILSAFFSTGILLLLGSPVLIWLGTLAQVEFFKHLPLFSFVPYTILVMIQKRKTGLPGKTAGNISTLMLAVFTGGFIIATLLEYPRRYNEAIFIYRYLPMFAFKLFLSAYLWILGINLLKPANSNRMQIPRICGFFGMILLFFALLPLSREPEQNFAISCLLYGLLTFCQTCFEPMEPSPRCRRESSPFLFLFQTGAYPGFLYGVFFVLVSLVFAIWNTANSLIATGGCLLFYAAATLLLRQWLPKIPGLLLGICVIAASGLLASIAQLSGLPFTFMTPSTWNSTCSFEVQLLGCLTPLPLLLIHPLLKRKKS